jgi:endonuclease-8
VPEGPEIRRAADRIAAAVVDEPMPEVWFAFERLKAYGEELSGHKVTAVDCRGKAMLTRFDNGLSVYTHNQLFGRWYIVRANCLPTTNRQLRFALKGQRRWALLYSAAEIEVLDAVAEKTHPYLAKLGPDILDKGMTALKITRRMQQPAFRGRQLAALLLDQTCLCGPGNYLRSEILFAARLEPHRKPSSLDTTEATRLGKACQVMGSRAYIQQGFTLEPKKLEQLKAEGADRFDLRHLVFNREGRPCPRCKRPILKEMIGGRRLYWCTHCQL